jgi:hypothetical protein
LCPEPAQQRFGRGEFAFVEILPGQLQVTLRGVLLPAQVAIAPPAANATSTTTSGTIGMSNAKNVGSRAAPPEKGSV